MEGTGGDVPLCVGGFDHFFGKEVRKEGLWKFEKKKKTDFFPLCFIKKKKKNLFVFFRPISTKVRLGWSGMKGGWQFN